MDNKASLKKRIINSRAFQGIPWHSVYKIFFFVTFSVFSSLIFFGCNEANTPQNRENSSLNVSQENLDSQEVSVPELNDNIFDHMHGNNDLGEVEVDEAALSSPKYSFASWLLPVLGLAAAGVKKINKKVYRGPKQNPCIMYNHHRKGSSVYFKHYNKGKGALFISRGFDDRSRCKNHYEYINIAVITKDKTGHVIARDTVSKDGWMGIHIGTAFEYSKNKWWSDNADRSNFLFFSRSFINGGPLGSALRKHYHGIQEDHKVHLEFRLHTKSQKPRYILTRGGRHKHYLKVNHHSHYRSLVFTPIETKAFSVMGGYYSDFDEFSDKNVRKYTTISHIMDRTVNSIYSFYIKEEKDRELAKWMKSFVSRLFEALDLDIVEYPQIME